MTKEEKLKRLKYKLQLAIADRMVFDGYTATNASGLALIIEAKKKELKAQEKLRRFMDKYPKVGR